jgi:hypothetical protein
MSVAFQVKLEVLLIELCCESGNAWANAVSGAQFKEFTIKKKRVTKRIMTMRIK